jgi:hypothetical protein
MPTPLAMRVFRLQKVHQAYYLKFAPVNDRPPIVRVSHNRTHEPQRLYRVDITLLPRLLYRILVMLQQLQPSLPILGP